MRRPDSTRTNLRRRPVVGVMGSGSRQHSDKARPLGIWLAQLGVDLLTGGGSGVMQEVSRAFAACRERKGLVIGILPGNADGKHVALEGYPNPWTEIVIRTHLPFSGSRGRDPFSRNHINILSSDVIVALPGSRGTSSEVRLALEYGKPLVAFIDDRNDIPDLPPELDPASFSEVQHFLRKSLKSRL